MYIYTHIFYICIIINIIDQTHSNSDFKRCPFLQKKTFAITSQLMPPPCAMHRNYAQGVPIPDTMQCHAMLPLQLTQITSVKKPTTLRPWCEEQVGYGGIMRFLQRNGAWNRIKFGRLYKWVQHGTSHWILGVPFFGTWTRTDPLCHGGRLPVVAQGKGKDAQGLWMPVGDVIQYEHDLQQAHVCHHPTLVISIFISQI